MNETENPENEFPMTSQTSLSRVLSSVSYVKRHRLVQEAVYLVPLFLFLCDLSDCIDSREICNAKELFSL